MRNSIHEKVSEFRNLIYIIRDNLNDKTSENNLLQNEVKEMKKMLEVERARQAEGQLATSMYNIEEPRRARSWTGPPPSEGRKKQYAEVLSGKNITSHKLAVRSKQNETTEAVKSIIKVNIDPTHMKIALKNSYG